MAGGRPSKYKKDYCDMLIAHMAQGYSFESFGAIINVHRDTLYEWEHRHVEFSDAKKIGMEKSLLWWESLGRAGAAGKLPNFNSGTWIFNVKNRFGWRDTVRYEGYDGGAIKYMDTSDRMARIQELLTKLDVGSKSD